MANDGSWLSDLADGITHLMDVVGAWGAGVAIAAENLFPPLPSEVILPMAGLAASRGGTSKRLSSEICSWLATEYRADTLNDPIPRSTCEMWLGDTPTRRPSSRTETPAASRAARMRPPMSLQSSPLSSIRPG